MELAKKKFVAAARTGEIPPGECRVFEVEGHPLLISNVDGSYHAIENICTHDDGPLGSGQLHGTEIECPRHGARFDVRTGAVRRMPAAHPVRSFPTRVEGDRILVEIEE